MRQLTSLGDFCPNPDCEVYGFTSALLELHSSPELRAQSSEEMQKIGFKRGLEVLQEELRDKFYKRGKKAD